MVFEFLTNLNVSLSEISSELNEEYFNVSLKFSYSN